MSDYVTVRMQIASYRYDAAAGEMERVCDPERKSSKDEVDRVAFEVRVAAREFLNALEEEKLVAPDWV
jgi:hypothetical protein